jgi:phenylacetate-coenzyme A ligase PaaK-like adenylate-forming protein
LRGRRDELVVASGGNLYPKLFENIISAVPGLTHDWQVVFKLEGVREIMEINIETTRPDEDHIRGEIREQGSLQYPDLMKNLALGIFDMRILIHPPGTMRVTRKLKRVVDRRHYAPSNASAPVRTHKEDLVSV